VKPAARPRVARRPKRAGPRLRAIALGIVALVGAAGGSSFWWWPRPADVSPIGPVEAIVFFGDSITSGHSLPTEQAFPALVGQALGVRAINAGVSGNTSGDALRRVEPDVLAHQPRLVVVQFGGNDFLRQVPKDETLRNLDAILDRLTTAGAAVVLLEMHVGLGDDPYLDGFGSLAAKYRALLVPNFMRGILSNPALKLDAIHPNAEGHQLLAQRVADALRPLLAAP